MKVALSCVAWVIRYQSYLFPVASSYTLPREGCISPLRMNEFWEIIEILLNGSADGFRSFSL